VISALEVFNEIRHINLRFTYLLTYCTYSTAGRTVMVVEMRPSRRLIGQFLSSSIIHWHGQQRRQSVGLIGCAAVPLGGVSVTCLPRNARIYHHLTPPTAAATDRRSQPIELPSSRLLVAQRRRRRQINSYC